MKAAISLPDPVFRAAERLARRLKKSRSELYADAFAAYVGARGAKALPAETMMHVDHGLRLVLAL